MFNTTNIRNLDDQLRLGPIDMFGAANNTHCAFSFRRLRTGWGTGKLAELRRSSDNATQDFSALPNGDFPVNDALNFAAGSNLFVRTWYDQSGFGQNAVQTTAANQPQFIASVEGLNNRPAMRYTEGSNMGLAIPTGANIDGIFSNNGLIWMICKPVDSLVQPDRFFDKFRFFASLVVADYTIRFQQTATGNGVWANSTPLTLNAAMQMDWQYNSSALSNDILVNINNGNLTNTTDTNPTGTISSDAGNDLWIGNQAAGSRGFPGYIAEFMARKFGLGSAQLALTRLNMRQYWGIN